jgi:hypothetical protein
MYVHPSDVKRLLECGSIRVERKLCPLQSQDCVPLRGDDFVLTFEENSVSELVLATADDTTASADPTAAISESESGHDVSSRTADNDGISAEARKLQELLAQEVIDLSKADNDEAFVLAEQVLAAHKMRFQRLQQGRNAALDALREHGPTLQDVGWTELPRDVKELATADESASSRSPQATPSTRAQAKPETGAGNAKGALQVLKGSNPKVFYKTGRVPKIGCFEDGTKDESKWRQATPDEAAEYARQRAKKPARR